MTKQRMTASEIFQWELATNPRCKEAPKTGQGFIIVGAKPQAARQKKSSLERLKSLWRKRGAT
jgi:hypothetical protein